MKINPSAQFRSQDGSLPSAAPLAGNQPLASAASGQTAFPPLGTTLSSYTPLSQTLAQPVAAPKRQWNIRKLLKRSFIVLLIVALTGGGYVTYKALENATKSLNGGLFGLLQSTKLKGEDQGRVNILLAGNSADDVGHSGGDLTDSIMIVSLDTTNHRAFMLSIPRDLLVDLPDEGYNKINAAYVYGKQDKFSAPGLPSGGMGELEQVIEQNMDINIDYYALVDYTALKQAVDSVGGIDVTIQSSDPRGLYDPSRDWTSPTYAPLVKLTNGQHHLTGQQALNLARARGDTYGSYGYAQSDFTRTANQRLMLTALKDKATSAGVISNPVKLGNLFDSFGNNVQTDFQTNEVRRLVDLVKATPSSNITSASLNDANGKNLLTSYTTRSGQSALVPAAGIDDFSDINDYIKQLMTPPSATNSTSSTTTDSAASSNSQ